MNNFYEKEMEEFDKDFKNEEGLFNTQSGWSMKCDPVILKDWIKSHDLRLLQSLKGDMPLRNLIDTSRYGHPKNSDWIAQNQTIDRVNEIITNYITPLEK